MVKKRFKGKVHKGERSNGYNVWTFYCSANKNLTKKKPKDKKKIWSLIFFLINIAVIAVILAVQLHKEGGVTSLDELVEFEMQKKFVLIACLCFLFANVASSLKLSIYHKKLQKKFRFGFCLKTHFISKYYTKITPFGLGGQPYEMYYLRKNGVKISNSLTMVSSSYVANKLMYALLALVMIITFRWNSLLMNQESNVRIIIVLAVISFVILAIFLTFVILMCVNKRLGNRIIVWIVKLLAKLKISKNPGLLYLKIMRPLLVFQAKMKKFFSSRGLTLVFLLLSLLEYVIEYSVPFFIYSAFNGFDLTIYWQLLSISVIIELACRLIPLPGGSGLAELSFYAIFASLFDAGVLFWALILWRIITYYSYLIVGIFIMIYDYVIGSRRLKKRIRN